MPEQAVLKLLIEAGIAIVSVGILGRLLQQIIEVTSRYAELERKEIADKLRENSLKLDKVMIGIERLMVFNLRHKPKQKGDTDFTDEQN